MTDLKSKLGELFPHTDPEWLKALEIHLPKYGIDTPEEIASFLSQVVHESVEFTRLEENLNYSSKRLMQVWPKRFPTLEIAEAYANNGYKLANFVYANRLGNGDEASGDGWRYRGRGPIQITGKTNYFLCGDAIGIDLIQDPNLLKYPYAGVLSACWYWKHRNLDAVDDDTDVLAETRLVNGAEHGLQQRQVYFDRIIQALRT